MSKTLMRATLLVVLLLVGMTGAAPGRVNTNKGNKFASVLETAPDEWRALLDTTSPAFWLGSNPSMDKGFLRFATNPTLDTAKLWLLRMNGMRNALHRMEKLTEEANRELIESGAIADDYGFQEMYKQAMGKSKSVAQKGTQADLSTLQGIGVFLLFNPKCPACKRQVEVLKDIPGVQPVQIGGEMLENIPGFEPSVWPDAALEEYIHQHNPERNVPMLLLYRADTNAILPLIGYSDIGRVASAAARLKQ